METREKKFAMLMPHTGYAPYHAQDVQINKQYLARCSRQCLAVVLDDDFLGGVPYLYTPIVL